MIDVVEFERVTYGPPPHALRGRHAADPGSHRACRCDRLGQHAWIAPPRWRKSTTCSTSRRALVGAELGQAAGRAPGKGAILSFTVDGAHAHDVAQILDRQGVAVRAGHHCAQPLMERLGVTATARASFAFYNTRGEVDTFIEALHRARAIFS